VTTPAVLDRGRHPEEHGQVTGRRVRQPGLRELGLQVGELTGDRDEGPHVVREELDPREIVRHELGG
jgi:hypothetical protein